MNYRLFKIKSTITHNLEKIITYTLRPLLRYLYSKYDSESMNEKRELNSILKSLYLSTYDKFIIFSFADYDRTLWHDKSSCYLDSEQFRNKLSSIILKNKYPSIITMTIAEYIDIEYEDGYLKDRCKEEYKWNKDKIIMIVENRKENVREED